jgi:hypothetical protein
LEGGGWNWGGWKGFAKEFLPKLGFCHAGAEWFTTCSFLFLYFLLKNGFKSLLVWTVI